MREGLFDRYFDKYALLISTVTNLLVKSYAVIFFFYYSPHFLPMQRAGIRLWLYYRETNKYYFVQPTLRSLLMPLLGSRKEIIIYMIFLIYLVIICLLFPPKIKYLEVEIL